MISERVKSDLAKMKNAIFQKVSDDYGAKQEIHFKCADGKDRYATLSGFWRCLQEGVLRASSNENNGHEDLPQLLGGKKIIKVEVSEKQGLDLIIKLSDGYSLVIYQMTNDEIDWVLSGIAICRSGEVVSDTIH